MPPKKKEKVLPPVRVTDEMYEEAQNCANDVAEYLSDFVRKAVEERITRLKMEKVIGSIRTVAENRTKTVASMFNAASAEFPEAPGEPDGYINVVMPDGKIEKWPVWK